MILTVVLAAAASSIVGSVVGVGGGLILLVSLSYCVPPTSLVPIHASIQCFLCTLRTACFWKSIQWGLVKRFYLGVIPATAAGSIVLSFVSELNPSILLLLIAIYVLTSVFAEGLLESLSKVSSPFYIGVVCGFFGLFVGSTGPVISTWLLDNQVLKEDHIATKSAMQSLAHVLKIPAFIFVIGDIVGLDFLTFFLVVVVGLVCTFVGKRLLFLINEKMFTMCVKVLLVFAALNIVYKFLEGF